MSSYTLGQGPGEGPQLPAEPAKASMPWWILIGAAGLAWILIKKPRFGSKR